MVIKVVPAILTDDPQALAKMIRLAESFCDYVQVDFMDGRFVPSNSVAVTEMAKLNTNITWEAHIMVEKPEDYVPDLKAAKTKRVIFHYEATPHPDKVIKAIKSSGLEAGMALNPETPINVVRPLEKDLDSVLFLSVNPGFYGAPFIPEVLNKITELRREYPELELSVDGGIKEQNIVQVAQTGVNTICAGSSVLLQPDPAAAYRRLSELAEQASK